MLPDTKQKLCVEAYKKKKKNIKFNNLHFESLPAVTGEIVFSKNGLIASKKFQEWSNRTWKWFVLFWWEYIVAPNKTLTQHIIQIHLQTMRSM